ncbi:hypothetical protein IEQ34_020368 [Dendrobium chrysotoxum]|uniref:Uncharacterized protein n=1 Tax=Dendrobium chrysotoxum TaxID=161865 RepID=A0AAV7G0R4_DENCH|nr:hypothetical protein IEQ34_020368 [Dendrobium chrysotoxum]
MAPEGTDLAAAVGLCVDRVWEEEMGLSCGDVNDDNNISYFVKSKEEMFRNQFNCPMMVLLIVEHTKESNRYNI